MVNYTYVHLNLHLRRSLREPSMSVDGTDGAADKDGGVEVDNDDDTNGSVGGVGGMVKPPVITSAKKSYQLKKEGL